MKRSDYPSLSQAASQASGEAQQRYMNVIRFDLVCMLLATALSIYNYQAEESKRIVYIVSGILLLVSILLTLLLKIKKYEYTWYKARALAESGKSLTWLYICRTGNFSNGTEDDNQAQFVQSLKHLTEEFSDVQYELDPQILLLPTFSLQMTTVRAMDLNERLTYYLKNRVENQRMWYTAKAKETRSKYDFWFWIILVSQAISIVSVVVLILEPSFEWNLVALFTTISATAISWLQTKKYQELSDSYNAFARHLMFVMENARNIQTENRFAELVQEVEAALSQEHRFWLARREQIVKVQ